MPPEPATQPHRRRYVERLLELYRHHPQTTGRVRTADRSLADHLYQQGVDIETVDAALLLVAARRTRTPQPCTIRSLHYFLPAIREVLEQPLDDGYLSYLKERTKLQPRNDPHLS